MRAISEMYMRSGGTASPKYCDECPNLTSVGKHYDCKLYPVSYTHLTLPTT